MAPESVSLVPVTSIVLLAPKVTAPDKLPEPVLVESVPPFTVTGSDANEA